jgi:hypothetical protein
MTDVARRKKAIKEGLKSLYTPFKIKPKITFIASPIEAVEYVRHLVSDNTSQRAVWIGEMDLPEHVADVIKVPIVEKMLNPYLQSPDRARVGSLGMSISGAYHHYYNDVRSGRRSLTTGFRIDRSKLGIEVLIQIGGDNVRQLLELSQKAIKVINSDLYNIVMDNLGLVFITDEEVVVVKTPMSFVTDGMGRMHSEEKPVIEYSDGTKIYMLDNMVVPDKVIEDPENLTRDEVMGIENAEVRRVLFEKMGADNFFKVMDFREMDKQQVNGNDVVLLRTKTMDRVARNYINYIQVTCTSTGRKFHLCVPPDINDAVDGLAWTFNMNAEDYVLIEET